MSLFTFEGFMIGWIVLAILIFFLLLKVTAPYGRHSSAKWGLQIGNRLGWILMEAPAMMVLMYYVIAFKENQQAIIYTLVAFFLFHYINRTLIFPFRIRTTGKKMPLVIVCSGIFFNLVNGFSLGYYFTHFAVYPKNYLFQPQFIAGVIIFLTGLIINLKADNILIHLRKPGETGYKIPVGWLFDLISCPNLFGEIIEWAGYAIMCWNLPATAFFIWTLANLVPRAISHHKWYQRQFENYPTERKVLLPFMF